jgi:membrane-associated two-gene conflict system component 1 (EACC1)
LPFSYRSITKTVSSTLADSSTVSGDQGDTLTGPAHPSAPDVQLTVSIPGELLPLRDWVQRAPRITVVLVQGPPCAGELGVGDVLQVSSTVAGTTAGLLLALRTLPEFIRSRRSDVKVTVTTSERELVLEADNVDDVLPILDRILDDRRPQS